jgi:glycosyltransferase involved in cell wall biosynthesis
MEIIVVDDGSKDETSQIVMSNARKDDRIRLLQQSNKGVAAARNYAIEAARGSYIAPCDADDIWYSQKIEKQVRYMLKSGRNVGLVYGWVERINEEDSIISYGRKWAIEGDVFVPLFFTNFVGGGSMPLIRRECIDHVGIYDCNLRDQNAEGAEDWDLYLRIAEKYQFGLVPCALLGYRITQASMSKNVYSMIKSIELVGNKFAEKYPELPAKILKLKKSMMFTSKSGLYYHKGEYQKSLRLILKAIFLDQNLILSPWVLYLIVKCILRVPAKNYKEDGRKPPPWKLLFGRPHEWVHKRTLFRFGINFFE